jgi:hypothetical protein
VVGATPAGIMAAIAAARRGSKVILTEYHGHVGGMSSSGLGKSDIENKDAIAGLFKEFTSRIWQFYVDKYGADSENVLLCKGGYYYEPSVAEKVFVDMIEETQNIKLMLNLQIEEAMTAEGIISGVVFTDRRLTSKVTLTARLFIDATYEGDLFALSGAEYRLGREGRNDFHEAHAGKIFFDYNDNVFLEGSTGEADDKLPAYTYRLCMTDDPANSYILTDPPEGYRREDFLPYLDDLSQGRLGPPKVYKEGHGYYPEHFHTMMRAFSFARIPNRKFDVNINPRPLAFPFGGENYAYPEADWHEREIIFARHRSLALGLLYFVQNDPEVPEAHRHLANTYHLALDEFTDNDHFAWQFYVREARRLKGKYTLTENDVVIREGHKRTEVFSDSIISGEFPIDSFPVSKEPSSNGKVLEGYIGMLEISPYQVPFRIMITEKVKNLVVPVAASTSHVAFSTIRMEPLWMGMGQAAGTAAHLCVDKKLNPVDLPVSHLQKCLIEDKQILCFFTDIGIDDQAFEAVQFWGTKGFFDSYQCRSREPIVVSDLHQWLAVFAHLCGFKAGIKSKFNGQGEHVFIDDFSSLLRMIFKGAADNKKQLVNKFVNDSGVHDSLYADRASSSPLWRGEVCMALYKLLQAIKYFV